MCLWCASVFLCLKNTFFLFFFLWIDEVLCFPLLLGRAAKQYRWPMKANDTVAVRLQAKLAFENNNNNKR